MCAVDAPCLPSSQRVAVTESEVVGGWELVAAAQRGDRDAFGQLYERYVEMVFRFVLFRVGGDRPLAEDLTSETFLRALRGIASVREQVRDVGAWLTTIARNLVRDHFKSCRYRRERTTAEPQRFADEYRTGYPRAVLWSGVGDRSPEEEVIDAATVAELMRGVAQLGRAQRECVLLRFLQGLSVSETAAVMGCTEGTVKSLCHRGVRRLAQVMELEQAIAGGER
jgi:RNA polymerase sigma-70 factor, ECF subfamily